MRLSPGRSVLVEVDGSSVFEVTNDGSRTRIDLGGGSGERLVLGDALKTLLNQFFAEKFDLHIQMSYDADWARAARHYPPSRERR